MPRTTTLSTDDRGRRARRRRSHRVLALGATVVAVVGLCGAPTGAAIGQARQGVDGQGAGSQLQRDADGITAIGGTGVQARHVTADGRHRAVTSGVADIRTGRPVPRDGHLRVGSVNKTFVATVALQLVGEGQLSLDDSVERWLPGVVDGEGYDPDAITVRHMLQHTSGLVDDDPTMLTPEDYYRNRFLRLSPEELVERAMAMPPAFAPGEGWSYSNTGYRLVGMIIERVTGRPWYTEVQHRIVEPLGLTETSWPGSSPTLPRPHARAYQRFTVDGDLTDVTLLADADASGGLISTTRDLNRFIRALFGGRLLEPTQLAEMQRTVPVDESAEWLWPGARYGLGVFRRPLPCGGTYWTPSGDQVGWSTRTGVVDGGRESVVVSMSTQARSQDSPDSVLRQERVASNLVEGALCRNR